MNTALPTSAPRSPATPAGGGAPRHVPAQATALRLVREHLEALEGRTVADLAAVGDDLLDVELLLGNVRLALGETPDAVPCASPEHRDRASGDTDVAAAVGVLTTTTGGA